MVNAWHWAQRIHYGIALWRPYPAYFWTITLPGWVQEPTTGYRILPKRFDNLRKSLTRAMGTWYYAAFVEEHPHRQYIPHLHIISLQSSPQRLKDIANHAGFGYQAMEVPITGGKAAWYVTKYVSKQGYQMPRNFRRVRICQAWPKLPDPIAELPIYARHRAETVAAYIARVSNLVGLDVAETELRYRQAQMEALAKRMEVSTKVQQ